MTVLTAMLVDAYRELNAKKLFWITLFISVIVVLTYGSIGFNENGISVLYGLKQVDSEYVNSTTKWARALYVGIFSDFVVALWLSWIAIILALISTCSMFPDFLAGGAIDIVLSKPISRVTLFVLKYLTSMLFVILQVLLFCVGIFLCVGLRIGEWNWMIFAAVPVVTLFYSYLYSVCVLTGVLTRSAITALLLTMLFWVSLWGVQTAEQSVRQFVIRFDVQAEEAQKRVDLLQARRAQLPPRDDEPAVVLAQAEIDQQLFEATSERDAAQEGLDMLKRWHGPTWAFMTVLPKTQLTISLLSRWLKDPEGFSITAMMRGDMSGHGMITDPIDIEMTRRLEREVDAYSTWYVVGTSAAFEAVVLALACLIFVRRDY